MQMFWTWRAHRPAAITHQANSRAEGQKWIMCYFSLYSSKKEEVHIKKNMKKALGLDFIHITTLHNPRCFMSKYHLVIIVLMQPWACHVQ